MGNDHNKSICYSVWILLAEVHLKVSLKINIKFGLLRKGCNCQIQYLQQILQIFDKVRNNCCMRQERNESNYVKMQGSKFELKYQCNEAEGQCIILEAVPVRFVQWRFILYIISNIFLLVPLLLTYWNDKFKRIFYMKFCDLARATHIYIVNYDEEVSIVAKERKSFLINQTTRKEMNCFVNRYMTYLIDQNQVVKLSLFDYKQRVKHLANVEVEEKGLTESQAYHLKYTYGPGTMVIRKPTVLQLFIKEVVKPLYIFLIFSVLFWLFAEQYYYFAATLFVVFVIGVIINLYQMVQLNNKIFIMAYYEIKMHVLRDSQVKVISSIDIVPGDVVFLKDPIKIPFEGIILEGSALINECALTGESVPVVKKADRLDRVHANPGKIDKNAFIYEGTTIIQVSDKKRMSKYEAFRQNYGIPVCVVRTNFVTTKGQLIRIILFPREQENVFQKQAMKFLGFLFVFAVVTYIILLVINYDYQTAIDLFVKFVDLILIAVPPALPVSMTFGIIYAVEKLQKKSIFCIAQNKVVTGGMIEFSCFDKTGTLTEDYMDFYCAVPAFQGKFHTQLVNSQEMSNYMIDNLSKKPYYLPLLNNMASNHSIVKIQASNKLIGDPMEIKLFNFGKFSLNQSHADPDAIFSFQSDRGHNGTVYRRYQFESQLQRMSVVAKSSLTQNFVVYAKGSPQMMLNVMKPSSVPKNYNEMLKEYASHGFRVLSVASKPINEEEMRALSREDIERDLIFNGFEVFQNKLKPQTKGAIQELKSAQIGCVMITGDNTLTGSNISYKCAISDKDKGLIIVDFINGKLVEENFVFHDYDDENQQFPADKPIAQSYIEDDIRKSHLSKSYRQSKRSSLRDRSHIEEFEPMKDNNEQFMFNLAIKAEETNCQLCITGRAFNELFSGSVADINLIHRRFMELATVFARTKPNDKAKIVMVYQQMGMKVSMCGDGANDCGALKQADIGLSLSQAEASISAPFTSQVTNITSMVELIKECRAGLATNFSLFNIMAIYSLIQYTSTIICQIFLQYPQDFQFLYWDLVLNFLPIVFVGYTATADRLSVEKPRDTLFSVTNIVQILIMFGIQFAGQIVSIVVFSKVQPDYYKLYGGFDNGLEAYNVDKQFGLDGVEGNAIFVFVNNIYLISVLAFSISHPWRKEFFTNIPFVVVSILALVLNVLLCMLEQVDWEKFSIIHLISTDVRLYLLIASLGFSVVIYVSQKCLFEPLTYRLIRKYPKIKWI